MSAPANTCGSQLSIEDLLRAATGKDANGNPFLRLVKVDGNGTDYFTCNNQGTILEPGAYFGSDEEGKIALRVHISNFT